MLRNKIFFSEIILKLRSAKKTVVLIKNTVCAFYFLVAILILLLLVEFLINIK